MVVLVLAQARSAQVDVTALQGVGGLSAANDGPTVLGQTTFFAATAAAGDQLQYRWGLGDGQVAAGAVISHTYSSAGPYKATVTAANAVSSASATTRATIASPLQAAFEAAPHSGPVPLLVTFVNRSLGLVDGCQWDFGDGFQSTSCADPSHLYVNLGTYTVSLTVSGLGEPSTIVKRDLIRFLEGFWSYLPLIVR